MMLAEGSAEHYLMVGVQASGPLRMEEGSGEGLSLLTLPNVLCAPWQQGWQ